MVGQWEMWFLRSYRDPRKEFAGQFYALMSLGRDRATSENILGDLRCRPRQISGQPVTPSA